MDDKNKQSALRAWIFCSGCGFCLLETARRVRTSIAVREAESVGKTRVPSKLFESCEEPQMIDPNVSNAQSAQLHQLIEQGAVHRITMAAAEETRDKFSGDEDQATLFLLLKAVAYFFALLVVRRGVKMKFLKHCFKTIEKDMRMFVPRLRKSLEDEPMEERKSGDSG